MKTTTIEERVFSADLPLEDCYTLTETQGLSLSRCHLLESSSLLVYVSLFNSNTDCDPKFKSVTCSD